MNLRLLLFSVLTFSAYLFFTSSSSGRVTAANQGNTGAPGDNRNTCVSCHNGGPLRVALNLALVDLNGDEVTEYEPGNLYTVRVEVDPTNGIPSAYGFQMVALDAPLDMNGADVRTWLDTATNNYKIAETTNRQYVEHAGPSSTNVFNVAWTAPATSSGSISFYAAGNGVNLNGGTSGDGAGTTKLEVIEKISSSIDDQEISSISTWPNPASDHVNVRFDSPFSGEIVIVDFTGRELSRSIAEADHTVSIDLASINANGVYILQARGIDGTVSSKRLVKK